MSTAFDRNIAFSRNLGLITQAELDDLKNKTVAIAGLGGVGGSHLLTLVRLGVGGFHISDMDTFGIENFNRQVGATMDTIGRPKIEVLAEMARAINPEVRIKMFPQGVTESNVAEFFSGVDAYVDGLDFFAFKARQMVFRYCYQQGIPATTVGPIGMGAALINFLPGKMSFDDYFQWKDSDTDLELAIKFLIGLTPKAPHRRYVVDPSRIDFKRKKGPSIPMGIQLCAGVLGTEIFKILLKRGKVLPAPHATLFDAYHNRTYRHYIPFGNRHPLQKLKFLIGKRIAKSLEC
jgi:molybdopterin/thiamine biosynthesis adenylyltransferase